MNLETLIRQAKPDYIQADSEKATSAILDRLEEFRPTPRRRISVRVALVVAAIVAMLLSGLTVNAATGGKLFGAILLNKDNRHIAKEPTYAAMQEVRPGESVPIHNGPILKSNIINQDQLQTLRATSITNIAVSKNHKEYSIPELLLASNADIVIFTKKKDAGWHLDKGEKMSIQFKLDDTDPGFYSKLNDLDTVGNWMEIGYIKNGELVRAFAKKAPEFAYTITADEAGEYYFYAQNLSAGRIVIASGNIE
ncbi:hypothetical protein D7Z26_21865 [Cohnella endophytica]|uniref:Uncharacterized protein n=1 Tax=Cohnella endophytica TaxID=2419778 RepID=A0A494XAS9_9BACL|nr:hypothetical protein [Cohnella endophytica]RKP47865.1 hypothetical protein D7Z26_21865 [Cohnella endophytica]